MEDSGKSNITSTKSAGSQAPGNVGRVSVRKLKQYLIKAGFKDISVGSAKRREQGGDFERAEQQESAPADPKDFNVATKAALDAVNTFLKRNKLGDPKRLFQEMDQDRNGVVDLQEFLRYFQGLKNKNAAAGHKESWIDKQMNKENLSLLFSALDTDRSGALDLAEFTRYLRHTEAVQNKMINNIDAETLARLDLQIDRLFRKVDADHSGYVETAELYNLLKPLRPGKISMAECEQLIARFDKDSDHRLDQEEFHAIVKAEMLGNMTQPLKDVENTKRILRQLDKDKDGQLTLDEFREAIFKSLAVKNVTEEQVEALVEFIDDDGNELIEIDEFLAIVQNAGMIDFSEAAAGGTNTEQADRFKKVQRCLAEIRGAMTFDLFEYFTFFGEKELPAFFEPSFLQPMLEKETKFQPSRYLNTDPNDKKLMNARDFSDVEKLVNIFVPDNVCFKFRVEDISNVPVPKHASKPTINKQLGPGDPGPKKREASKEESKGFSLDDVESRELRIILYDLNKDEYISNAYIIPASASEDGKTWLFGEVSQGIKLATEVTFKNESAYKEGDSNYKKCGRCARGGAQKPDLYVIFELVMTLRRAKEGQQEGKGAAERYQVTSGWGIKPLKELQARKKDDGKYYFGRDLSDKDRSALSEFPDLPSVTARIHLHGGSPANEVKIDESQVEEKNIKKKAGGLAAFFRQRKEEEEPASFFMEITAFAVLIPKLSLVDRLSYDYLPCNFIINATLLNFIFAAQTHIMSRVSKNLQPESDFIVQQLKKCLDVTDINILMGECWREFYSLKARLGPAPQTAFEEMHKLLEASMRTLVSEIFVHIFDSKKFAVDWVYPVRPSPLTAHGFIAKETEFKESILSTLAEHENTSIQTQSQKAREQSRRRLEDSLKKERLDPPKPKDALAGEGTDFVSSGMPMFSLHDVMGADQDGAGLGLVGTRSGAASFENFLNKHKGKVQALPGAHASS